MQSHRYRKGIEWLRICSNNSSPSIDAYRSVYVKVPILAAMTSELAEKSARMSAGDFLKQVTPAARRSKLVPWAADIRLLREAGCSLSQIRAFLAHNDVSIAVSTLNAFITRHLGEVQPVPIAAGEIAAKTQSETVADAASADPTAIAFKSSKQLAAENPTLSKTEIRDLYTRQFETSPPNPLADLIRQQEERKRAARVQTDAGGAESSPTTASG